MRSLVLASALAWIGWPLAAPGPGQEGSPVHVLPIQAINPQGVRQGTCFVVFQDDEGGRRTVWFVTSARLFDRQSPHRARILMGSQAADISGDDILMPFENHRDIAVLRAEMTGAAFRALPLRFDQVHVGTSFMVSGYDHAGGPLTVPQRVAIGATRALYSDGTMSALAGCQGAPAIVDGRVFGVVSECAPNQRPEIMPMVVARSFLLRTIPRAVGQPATAAPR
jgi:hypothetical protein